MFGHQQDVQEEAKLDMMQRVWQAGRRNTSSNVFFEEANETDDILTITTRQNSNPWNNVCVPLPEEKPCNEIEAEHHDLFDLHVSLIFILTEQDYTDCFI